MRVVRSAILLCVAALLASACGGPEDAETKLAAACDRQIDQVHGEASSTPTAESTQEAIDNTTIVECAGQQVRLEPVDGEDPTEAEADRDDPSAENLEEDTVDDEAAEVEEDAATLDPAARELFVTSCGSCHALSDADTSGSIGPPLDDTDMDAEAIEAQIVDGGGAMPPGLLEGEDATNVAAYVAGAAAQSD